MVKSVLFSALLILIAFTSVAQFEYPYDFIYEGNPLVRNHGAADPDAHVWGDTVWLYCSQDHSPGYEAMDGYHAFSSTDLINWTDHDEVLHSRDISWGPSGWMWAPGAARKNGKYYLYYPHKDFSGDWRIGVAISDVPEGPFTDTGEPLEGIGGIDPAIFIDDDGEAYIYNNSAIVAKLKPSMTELAESLQRINYDINNQIEDNYLEGFAEGSYMHKREGIYYYSYSNWHNDEYQAFYAMGDNPYGPFEWKGPMAPNPKGAQDHHSVIEFKGHSYYFYHIAVQDYPEIRDGQSRITCYDRLYYNRDGTIHLVGHTYGPTNLLTLNANNGIIASDPPGRSYAPGKIVTLTAICDLGFGFDSWGGDLSGSENPTRITMDSDKNVSATFVSIPTYELTTNATNGSVLVDPPGGVYNEGTLVTLTAIDNFGYDFSSWSNDLNGSENPVTITMNGDKNVTANFIAVPTYNLTIHSTNGIVELTPPGGTYEEGQEVSLKASADYGYEFKEWSGDLSGFENPLSILLDSNINIDAKFSHIEGVGSIVFATNCGGTAYRSVEGINFSADKNFSGGGSYSTSSDIIGTIDDKLYRTERFGNNFSYNKTLPNGSYEVNLLFAEIFHSSTGQRVFNVSIEDKLVISNLDIYPMAGKNTAYKETHWVDLEDGYLNITFNTINDNAKISAIMVLQPEGIPEYSLNTVSTNGSIELDPPGGIYERNTDVTLTALPDLGYGFSAWSEDLSGSDNPAVITMDSDKTIAASFIKVHVFYLVTETENGTISLSPPGQVYNESTVILLTAIPETGYRFSNWSGDLSGSENPDTIVMDGNKNISALFSTVTGLIDENCCVIGHTKLEQNYPNPFTTETTIPYQLVEGSHVRLSALNFLGQQVDLLIDEYKTAGNYRITWHPFKNGIKVPYGLYIFRLESGENSVFIKKSILVD